MMDFSISSEGTGANVSINPEDMYNCYKSLKTQYLEARKQIDKFQQSLHEAKKNNQIVSEIRDHLASELETWQKNEVILKQEHAQKVQALNEDMEQLRQEKWKEAESYSNTIETLESKIRTLEAEGNVPPEEKSVCRMDDTKVNDELRRLEEENSHFKDLLEEQNGKLVGSLGAIEELKVQVDVLTEKLESARVNLENKREELSSVNDMLQSAQESLLGANSELQQIKQQANNHAPKGNSLFAEVDDKRQEMVKSYSQLKDKVHQLNRELSSKQSELDSLLCEKKALWEEYSGQANHHDDVLNRAFERRITDLEKENDQLHREIAQWYEANLNPASSTITNWVAGVLSYYREENFRITNEFAACSMDNLNKEKKIRELHRQLVTWRTNATKANATVSQLKTTMHLNDKVKDLSDQISKHNITNISDKSDKEKASPLSSNSSCISYEKDNSIISQPSSNNVYTESSQKPGILVTGATKSKTVKKATFE